MSIPPNNSPLWPLASLTIVCITLCVLLDKVYDHGFVMDKDGLTVLGTVASALIVPVARLIFGGRTND